MILSLVKIYLLTYKCPGLYVVGAWCISESCVRGAVVQNGEGVFLQSHRFLCLLSSVCCVLPTKGRRGVVSPVSTCMLPAKQMQSGHFFVAWILLVMALFSTAMTNGGVGAAAAAPLIAHSIFKGAYFCAQGFTLVSVTLDAQLPSDATITTGKFFFNFNNACEGEYGITMQWMNASQYFVMTGGDFLFNPCGYSVIPPFPLAHDGVKGILSGYIGSWGCSTMRVIRSTPHRPCGARPTPGPNQTVTLFCETVTQSQQASRSESSSDGDSKSETLIDAPSTSFETHSPASLSVSASHRMDAQPRTGYMVVLSSTCTVACAVGGALLGSPSNALVLGRTLAFVGSQAACDGNNDLEDALDLFNSPLQLQIGNAYGSAARGALLGNVGVVWGGSLCVAALVVGGFMQLRGEERDPAFANMWPLCHRSVKAAAQLSLPGSALTLFPLLLQPVAMSATQLVSAYALSSSSSQAISVVDCCLSAAVLLFLIATMVWMGTLVLSPPCTTFIGTSSSLSSSQNHQAGVGRWPLCRRCADVLVFAASARCQWRAAPLSPLRCSATSMADTACVLQVESCISRVASKSRDGGSADERGGADVLGGVRRFPAVFLGLFSPLFTPCMAGRYYWVLVDTAAAFAFGCFDGLPLQSNAACDARTWCEAIALWLLAVASIVASPIYSSRLDNGAYVATTIGSGLIAAAALGGVDAGVVGTMLFALTMIVMAASASQLTAELLAETGCITLRQRHSGTRVVASLFQIGRLLSGRVPAAQPQGDAESGALPHPCTDSLVLARQGQRVVQDDDVLFGSGVQQPQHFPMSITQLMILDTLLKRICDATPTT